MVCNEFESMIPMYLEKKFSTRQMDRFLAHLDECRECRNEFEIRYIVEYGLTEEMEFSDYNFIKRIDNELMEARRQVNDTIRKSRISVAVYIATNIIVLLCAGYFLLF